MRQRPKKKPPVQKKKALKRPLKSFKKVTGKLKRKVAGKLKRALKAVPVLSARVIQTAPVAPAAPAGSPVDDRIPSHYGDNKLVLLVRDPWWLFAYWEIAPSRQEELNRQIHRDGHKNKKTVLRVYDVTRCSLPKHNSFFDIELNFFSDNWYIDVGIPDREWVAEIGYRTDDGRFYALARSNSVRTPAFGLSDVLDEEWMLPEDIYYRIIGRTLGAGSQEGSLDIRRLLEKYLRNVISSERTPNSKPSQAIGARLGSD